MGIARGVLSGDRSHRFALSSLLYQTSSVASPPQRQAKYSENKLKCTKARNDYLLNLVATNAVVAKYYIHDVSDMIDVSTPPPAHLFVCSSVSSVPTSRPLSGRPLYLSYLLMK